MPEPVLRFENVSKRFRIGETHDSLRDMIAAKFSGWWNKGDTRREKSSFWAVENVDFDVSPGEALGIIGPNEAGKSTILKLLAGILTPDAGRVHVDGRLAALIEVGAGFHGDLTGRENIFLNGSLLGMKREEIRSKLDDIVAFAGLQRFLDMPVKRYSSGMYARLGFSIAAHVDPDILLVDEVLSVGDAVFRLRCMDRMRDLLRKGTTLVFVTHNLEQMQSICDRAVVLESGRVVFHGDARQAVGQYLSAMSRSYAQRPPDLMEEDNRESGAIQVETLQILNHAGNDSVWVRTDETVVAKLTFRVTRPIPRLVIELNMRARPHENLLSVNSGRDGITFSGTVGTHTISLRLPAMPLAGGQYLWNVRMWDADSGRAEIDTPFRYPMAIDDGGCKTGVVSLNHEWSFARDKNRNQLFTQTAGRGEEPAQLREVMEEPV